MTTAETIYRKQFRSAIIHGDVMDRIFPGEVAGFDPVVDAATGHGQEARGFDGRGEWAVISGISSLRMTGPGGGAGMAVRDRLRKGAAQYLEPDEQVQAVFYAKRPEMEYNDRAVVATDRRLLLLRLNFFGRPTGLAGEVPRETKLGPCNGFMHPIDAFGTRLDINRRFFKDVAEADRAAGF